MIDKVEKNVFEKILGQVFSLIEEAQKSIQDDSETYTLSFTAFTTNLLFEIICQIKSIGKLIVEIKTSQVAKELGLPVVDCRIEMKPERKQDAGMPVRKIRPLIYEGPQYLVNSVNITGNHVFDSKKIKKQTVIQTPGFMTNNAWV